MLLVSPDAQTRALSSCQTEQQILSSSAALLRETDSQARLTRLSPFCGEVGADISNPGHQRGLWHCQLLQHVEVICGSLVHGATRWQQGAAGGCLGKGVGPTEDLQGSSRRRGRELVAQGFPVALIPVCRWCTATCRQDMAGTPAHEEQWSTVAECRHQAGLHYTGWWARHLQHMH